MYFNIKRKQNLLMYNRQCDLWGVLENVSKLKLMYENRNGQ